MFKGETTVRVRYGETDKMGYVYYGYYSLYYETARTEVIRELGLPYSELEARGIMLPVARMNVKYVLPAKYDELLRIVTEIPEVPNRFIKFRHEIYNPEDELINIAELTLLFMDDKTRSMSRAPQDLIDKLKPYYS